MSSPDNCKLSPEAAQQFLKLVGQISALYIDAAEIISKQAPEYAEVFDGEPRQVMADLANRLVLRVVMEMASADGGLSLIDRSLALILFERLSNRKLRSDREEDAIRLMVDEHDAHSWQTLLSPFDRIPVLRALTAALEAHIRRLANFVAKLDGVFTKREETRLRHILAEFSRHLHPIPFADEEPDAEPLSLSQVIDSSPKSSKPAKNGQSPSAPDARQSVSKDAKGANHSPPNAQTTAPPPERYEDLIAELDQLIGLAEVKTEVRQLANFLNVQRERAARGKPRVHIGLHTVFAGNPGTGKTTVARIFGRILRSLGVLEKGHLVETDRSGLVAEYAGQTGPKTHKIVDAALGGVLFIDEAYSLVGTDGADAFGSEAVQALLKRMEDDRERLVVILAGYEEPLQRLLDSNPGLASRFPRTIRFANYAAHQLGRIFEGFCTRHAYRLATPARLKLLWGMQAEIEKDSEHFGNAREARNCFEDSLRRHADRIVSLKTVSDEVLETLEASDLFFRKLDERDLPKWIDSVRFRLSCAHCKQERQIDAQQFGQATTCSHCTKPLAEEWPELTHNASQ